jgi:chemotaxis methyl-accepting protein methylase
VSILISIGQKIRLHRTHLRQWRWYIFGPAVQWLEKKLSLSPLLSQKALCSFSYLFRDVEDYKEVLHAAFMKQERELRILCVGCATGEEPYSIAIVCDDLKIPVSIVGIDLSSKAITTASEGVFDLDKQEARTQGDEGEAEVARLIKYYSHYFTHVGPNERIVRLREDIRQRVEFYKIDVCYLPFRAEFDFVVCRKMLYYLPEAYRTVAVQRMIEALRPGLSPSNIIFDKYTSKQPFFRELCGKVLERETSC